MNKPNPESKTSRVILQALSLDEKQKVSTFKKLCRQDGITEKDMMLEALDLLFVKHRIRLGGNPQMQVDSPLFTGETVKEAVKCCKCGKTAVYTGLHLVDKKTFDYCRACFSEVPLRYDSKVWYFKRLEVLDK